MELWVVVLACWAVLSTPVGIWVGYQLAQKPTPLSARQVERLLNERVSL